GRSPEPDRTSDTPQSCLLEQSAPPHLRLSRRRDPAGTLGRPYTAPPQLPRQPSALLQLLQRFQISFGTHALVVSHHRTSLTRKRRQKCHPFMKASPIYRSVIHLRKSKSKRKLEPPLSKVP